MRISHIAYATQENNMSFIGNNPKWNTSTYNPQSADPANPTEGMVFRSDGTSRAEGLWEYKNGEWQQIGGDVASSLATFVQITNESDVDKASNWSTGNNATFLGGGTLQGTFADNTATPLNGEKSFTYTQAAGSLNDYISSEVKDVPLRSRQQLCLVKLVYTNDRDWETFLSV